MKVPILSGARDQITEAAVESSSAKMIEPGAVLVVTRGMILAHTVPSAVLATPATVNQDMKVLALDARVDPYYLTTVFTAQNQALLSLVESSSHGTKRLPTDALLDWELPLPPLAEQREIVTRAQELMSLCDRLADGLRQSQTLTGRVLDAALVDALTS